MVNLEWYRTFKAVYQTGSITAASKILFISQPNVSQHIAALEAYVGQKLFERKPKIVPTSYGKYLYTQLIQSLDNIENIETKFKATDITKQSPVIRLGTPREFFHAVVTQHLSNVPAQLIISFGTTKELINELVNDRLDFVISTQLIENKNIEYEYIWSEKFVIVGSESIDTTLFDQYIANNQLSDAEKWLFSQTWYSYSNDLAIIRRFWLKNFKKRPIIKPQFTIPDANIILHALTKNEGIAVCSHFLAEDALQKGKIKVIWEGGPNIDTTNALYLAYNKMKVTDETKMIIKKIIV